MARSTIAFARLGLENCNDSAPHRARCVRHGIRQGRMALKNMLPASCTFTPSDLVDRGNGTFVLDLNRPNLPEFPPHHVTVFGGVLEYVYDVPRLISHLAQSTNVIVASYAVTELNRRRRSHGWVNDFTSTQFISVFQRAGFSCDQMEKWRSQIICRFTKTPKSAQIQIEGIPSHDAAFSFDDTRMPRSIAVDLPQASQGFIRRMVRSSESGGRSDRAIDIGILPSACAAPLRPAAHFEGLQGIHRTPGAALLASTSFRYRSSVVER